MDSSISFEWHVRRHRRLRFQSKDRIGATALGLRILLELHERNQIGQREVRRTRRDRRSGDSSAWRTVAELDDVAERVQLVFDRQPPLLCGLGPADDDPPGPDDLASKLRHDADELRSAIAVHEQSLAFLERCLEAVEAGAREVPVSRAVVEDVVSAPFVQWLKRAVPRGRSDELPGVWGESWLRRCAWDVFEAGFARASAGGVDTLWLLFVRSWLADHEAGACLELAAWLQMPEQRDLLEQLRADASGCIARRVVAHELVEAWRSNPRHADDVEPDHVSLARPVQQRLERMRRARGWKPPGTKTHEPRRRVRVRHAASIGR